jgi:hypothetical protein
MLRKDSQFLEMRKAGNIARQRKADDGVAFERGHPEPAVALSLLEAGRGCDVGQRGSVETRLLADVLESRIRRALDAG